MQPSAADSGVDGLLDKQEIIACIKEMGSFESGFENNYEKIIDYACKSVEASILPTQFANAAELIFLAAAKAYSKSVFTKPLENYSLNEAKQDSGNWSGICFMK